MHGNSDDDGTGRSTTRRRVLRAAGASGLALGVGGSALGGGVAHQQGSFHDLQVSDDNHIVDEAGDPMVFRGVSILDPRRLWVSRTVRGKTGPQVVDAVTSKAKGWHPNVVRVPASPVDIGGNPKGEAGPVYGEDHPAVNDDLVDADDRLQNPPQPKAFTEKQLQTYLTDHYDDVVERCKERGVYCIIDFHRHWHEQTPGDGEGNGGPEGDAQAENHLPFDSPYTNYWARNTYYGDEGRDVPASWGYVDQRWRNEADSPYFEGQSDFERRVADTPYDKWTVNQDLLEEAKLFWRVVAQRYGDEPHVVFEAYNEPTEPGIWGPAAGDCEWYKQVPLWETFRQEFAQPIVDTIRDHSDRLVLMGLPAWSLGTQGLHWSDFEDDNLAVTWHNWASYAVSDAENWLNDTQYGSEPCTGWEPKESQGLQNAQSIRPVVVTEWGWASQRVDGSVDLTDVGYCLPSCYPSEGPGVDEYGQPFLDAIEGDDRISWVAWSADVLGPTTLFNRDFQYPEVGLDLPDHNWYAADQSSIPDFCTDLPCAWTARPAPAAGEFVKSRLAALDPTPTPTAIRTPDSSLSWPTDPSSTDPDGDGEYEDLSGNGEIDNQDVVAYFRNMGTPDDPSPMAQNGNLVYYDYTDNGHIDYQDLISLFEAI